MQRHQKLLRPQLVLVDRHHFGQRIIPQRTCSRHQGGPLEFREETLDEAEVGLCGADLDDGVLEDERVVVFCAVFWERGTSAGSAEGRKEMDGTY